MYIIKRSDGALNQKNKLSVQCIGDIYVYSIEITYCCLFNHFYNVSTSFSRFKKMMMVLVVHPLDHGRATLNKRGLRIFQIKHFVLRSDNIMLLWQP